jgi:hypothetical protein
MTTKKETKMRWTVALAAALLALLLFTAAAQANYGDGFGIAGFDGAVTNQNGSPFTQGGGHPYQASTTIQFNTVTNSDGVTVPDGNVKDIRVDLPAGFIGNPQAVPTCSEDQVSIVGTIAFQGVPCTPGSQVGTVTIDMSFAFGQVTLPVYNIQPPPGVPAEFAFNALGTAVVRLVPRIRTGSDYGISIDISNLSQSIPFTATTLTLWGVPADSSHDPQRGQVCLLGGAFCPNNGGASAGVAPKPFLTNPTDCSTGPVTTTLHTDSWERPGDFKTASFVSHDNGTPPNPVGPTACDRLPFDPSLTMRPSVAAAGRPSGYTVDLHMPYIDNPDGLSEAALKTVRVKLPQGVSVSPSSANGLGACDTGDIGIGSASEPTCPDSSKIGTVSIDTPLLDQPMTGSVYLAKPTSSQLLKIYLVAEGSGVLIKLPGTIDPAPNTGQLTATFDNNPQLPFTDLVVKFKDGQRAPLVNPPSCGPATTITTFTAWSGAAASSTDTFNVSQDGHGAACPSTGFAPGFTAGTVNPVGGKDSPFTLTFSRTDQEQTLGNIAVDLPKGLLGRISSVPVLCAEAQAAAGSCPDGSRIGSTTTAAGPGAQPFYLPGSVYLTGPYKGGPFGMSIVVPAIAGPFDLGTVVVRAAIYVDSTTAALRVVSDPLPTILQGIPLQIRSVNILIDRGGFMFNPTNCSASSVNARISSSAGAAKDVSNHFQVTNCAVLPFRPKLAVTVGRKGHTGTRATVPLTAVLTQGKGEANNKVVDLLLPGSLNARLGPVRNACTMAAFDAGTCGSKARVGNSSAVTPVLRNPLTGSAYFVKNPKRGALPFLMVALRGQVSINLRGVITTPHGRLETRFETIPDVPITRFRLSLSDTTQNGPLGAVSNLCTAANKAAKANIAFRAQNNKLVAVSQTLKIIGCATAKK